MRRNSFPQSSRNSRGTRAPTTFSDWLLEAQHYSISRSRASTRAFVKDVDRSSRESHEVLSSDEKIQRIRLDHLDDLAVTFRTTWPQRSHFFYYCRFFSWDRCTLFPVNSVVCGFVFFLIDIVQCCYNFAEWNLCCKCDAV